MCLSKEVVCNGQPDCLDDSDEMNCSTTTTTSIRDHFDHRWEQSNRQENPKDPFCRYGFPCPDGKCISLTAVCDGTPDCDHGFDELHCKGQREFNKFILELILGLW